MLVAPVTKIIPTESRTIEFKGLNKRALPDEGEMSDMKNLTSDGYPVLRPRKLRGKMTLPVGAVTPLEIISRYEKIALIAKDSSNNVHFYFDGTLVNQVTGIDATTKMVAINNKICFFPQKTLVELDMSGSSVTIKSNSYKTLDASIPATESIEANINTTKDGQTLTFPEDTDLSMFKPDDAINIEGTLTYGEEDTEKEVTVSCLVIAISENVMTLSAETFIELTVDGTATGTLEIPTNMMYRKTPNFNVSTDHIMEWNNRLWMAKYEDNTIYACKLGDPTNWQYFQNTSVDSYYAEQGSDGMWTGCAAYSKHVIFFKENSMTRIYGTAPSNYQLLNTHCYGIEEGSSESVIAINDMIFYNSPIGLMAYDGDAPYPIAEKFGDMKYHNCVGGTDGKKYYVSLDAGSGNNHDYHLMVLDIDRGLWHREDATAMAECCTHDNHLYFISGNNVWIVDAETTVETNMEWMAIFGPFDEYVENKKIYSKISLRLEADAGSSANVYISMDDGNWELVNTFSQARKGGMFIPIVPRRCDRYSIKVVGTGKVDFKALTRRYRVGGTL